MKDFKIIFKIVAAVFVVSAAICTIVIFKKELTELLSGIKQKLESKKTCCNDFADFDDV